MTGSEIHIRRLGRRPYASVLKAMQDFTDARGPEQVDELWLVEHEPVFTQGLNGSPEHLLNTGAIPVVQTDRGGQVTYHGPGQIVVYCLIDVKRAKIGVRSLVTTLETSVIELLSELGIDAYARADAPGVYVGDTKLASLGLRIRRGCSYHGVSLNVEMDLSPFELINPCGYPGLIMGQVADLTGDCAMQNVSDRLLRILVHRLACNVTQDTVDTP